MEQTWFWRTKSCRHPRSTYMFYCHFSPLRDLYSSSEPIDTGLRALWRWSLACDSDYRSKVLYHLPDFFVQPNSDPSCVPILHAQPACQPQKPIHLRDKGSWICVVKEGQGTLFSKLLKCLKVERLELEGSDMSCRHGWLEGSKDIDDIFCHETMQWSIHKRRDSMASSSQKSWLASYLPISTLMFLSWKSKFSFSSIF